MKILKYPLQLTNSKDKKLIGEIPEDFSHLPYSLRSFHKMRCPKCGSHSCNGMTGYLGDYFIVHLGCNDCAMQVRYKESFHKKPDEYRGENAFDRAKSEQRGFREIGSIVSSNPNITLYKIEDQKLLP